MVHGQVISKEVLPGEAGREWGRRVGGERLPMWADPTGRSLSCLGSTCLWPREHSKEVTLVFSRETLAVSYLIVAHPPHLPQ